MLVTHRVSMLDNVKFLLVLDNGKLVAQGPKQDVLEAISKGKVPIKDAKS